MKMFTQNVAAARAVSGVWGAGTAILLLLLLAWPASVFAAKELKGDEAFQGPQTEAQGLRIQPAPRDAFRVSIWTDRDSYWSGDRVRVFIRATRDCYVYVFNTDAVGEERQIFPNYFDRSNFIRRDRTYYIPDESHARYIFEVSGPAGRELLRAVAVAERYDVCAPYDRLGSSIDPYPLRKGGAEGLLQELRQGGQSVETPEALRPPPEPTPADTTRRPGTGGARDGGKADAEALRIAPVPIPPPPPRPRYGYAEDETSFYVREGRWRRPEPNRYGSLYIASRPSGARIILDGVDRGETPQTIRGVLYGTHTLRLEKRGYRAHTQQVEVYGESTGHIEVRLRAEDDRPPNTLVIPGPPLPPLPPIPVPPLPPIPLPPLPPLPRIR